MKNILTRPIKFPLWFVLIFVVNGMTQLAGNIGWPLAVFLYLASFCIGIAAAFIARRRQGHAR